jgi:hypothetical protein
LGRDQSWLSFENLITARPSRKLLENFVDPFLVKVRIGRQEYHPHQAKLILKINNVFQISLQGLHKTDAPSKASEPFPLQAKCKVEYKVEVILNSKRICRKLVYLVKWISYSPRIIHVSQLS